MRYPSLSLAFLVAASLVTSACGDDPMVVDRADATPAPDAPVVTPDAAPDATVPPADAAPADAAPADAEPADAEPADASPPDASPPGLQLPSLGNNGGRASVVLGSGADDLSLLRKQVNLQVTGASSDLEVGPAFVTRTSASSSFIYAFVRVTNHGTQRRCFDDISSADYLDAAGLQLAHTTGGFVYGTVGMIDGDLASDSCLGPGESSYVPDILQVPYDQVAGISAHLTVGQTAHDPNTSIVPQDIAIAGQHLSLNARNLGPSPGKVYFTGSHWFAFDAANQPVAFGFLDPCPADQLPELAVGATLSMCDNFLFYRGTSVTVQARTPFEQVTSSKLTATSPALRAVAASRARLRDAFSAAKRR